MSAEVLALLSSRTVVVDRPLELVSEGVALLSRLDDQAAKHLVNGFSSIVLRAVETRLLADPEIRRLALYWDALLGTADEVIRRRVEELLGIPPSDDVVRYLKACVRGSSSRYGMKSVLTSRLFAQVAETQLERSAGAVRCHHCGYHFLRQDFGEDRLEVLDDLRARFSEAIHPARVEDRLKPWRIGDGTDEILLTRANLDHLTPEAGFGYSEPDNLVVACAFCNNGRTIYRRHGEAIGTTVAASLQGCPGGRAHSMARQVAVVAAILAADGRCLECLKGTDTVELTVCAPEELVNRRWLAPWAATVRCYDCLVRDG